MAHFDDLTRCGYFSTRIGAPPLLAVGWLERGFEYSKGVTDNAAYSKLKEMFDDPWSPILFGGSHTCDLCAKPDAGGRSYYNLFVPGDGVIYVAPEGILHYIAVHGYWPPVEFCNAVWRCPEMESPAYFDALRACGWTGELPSRAEIEAARHAEMLEIGRLEAVGNIVVGWIDDYASANGRYPGNLTVLGKPLPTAGAWSYDLYEMGMAVIDWARHKLSRTPFRPPQRCRLSFRPASRPDIELAWYSESRRWSCLR